MLSRLFATRVDRYFESTFAPVAPPVERAVYRTVAGRALETFIYPAAPHAPATGCAIALFYGGGWLHGNPWQLAAIARDLSERGVTVYLPEYRVAEWDGASAREGLDDVRYFFGWMKDRHPEDHLFFGGSSAGAFLSARVGLMDECRPQGLVLINPALSVRRRRLRLFWRLLKQPKGFGVDDLVAMDPVNNLEDNPPPTLILHGDWDLMVPLAWVEEYVTAARAKGGHCDMVIFHRHTHGFANQSLFPNAHDRTVEEIVGFVNSRANPA